MTHERNVLGVMDALDDDARDDAWSNQFSHAPDAVSGDDAKLSTLPQPGVLSDLQLELIAYSVYRRPPPTCQ